ncbi:hypothetical protein GCM10022254_41580 [Actinomadura meridiana]|uniref:Type VII secretion protein EccE n=1 Tax=Actinomadura meridiana TaxID=559626 RepID=A0ABP8C7I9_9ACTN
MNGGGPLEFFTEHRTLISQVLVGLGVLVLLIVIANRLARRVGGWYFVRRRVRREIRLTVAAFAAPVRRWLRYRRQVWLLSRLLGDPAVWGAGEEAIRSVDAATPEDCRPYAAVVGADLVGVLIAGRDVPRPTEPWIADDTDPRTWWSVREIWQETAAAPPPRGRAVLLTSVGLERDRAVFLDLAEGPPVTALYGDERARRAVLQAMAAQLDRRLRPGAVVVAEGVHAHHSGPPAEQAMRDAANWQDACGAPAFAVCAGPLAEPVPPDGPSVLVAGRARGRARLLSVRRDGSVAVHGSPLRPTATALPIAVARSVRTIPPLRLPMPAPDHAPRTVPVRDAAPLGQSAAASSPSPSPSPSSASPPASAPAPAAAAPVSPSGQPRSSASTGASPAAPSDYR